MRFAKTLIAAILILLAGWSATAAHTEARLALAADTARPGDTVLAGIELRMDDRWHTYWRNPGGPGIATEIAWQLPTGVTAGEIQWPTPQKLVEQEFTTYIYENEVVLIVPLQLSSNLPPGRLDLKAKVKWLECEVQCVPGSAQVQATLAIGPEPGKSKDAGLIEAWLKKLPQDGRGLSAHARWEKTPNADLRPVLLEWNSAQAVKEADFFPYAAEHIEFQGRTERMPADSGKVRLRAQVKKLEGDWPGELAGLIVQTIGDQRQGFEVKLALGSTAVAKTTQSLWEMLLYAFLGGLILNIMPCVLPVIALKILGFVNQAKESPARVRFLGWVYAAGVLVSFLAMAGLVIGLKAAGHKAGWGMQFANPQFVVVLTVVVTLVALNLFGLFEVTLSGRVMGAAGTLASRHGASGAFFNGALATILATPCTAPFLAPALGFAFAQPPAIILLFFAMIAAGLAFPYVLLSWQPAWLRFLPKPGVWMEKFKVAMGFPMLATAIWLSSLLPIHYGDRAWWLGIFLAVVALAAWLFGEFVQRGRSRRGFALAACLGTLIAGYFVIVEGQLRWRVPAADTGAATASDIPAGIAWQPWSPEAVAKAQAEGKPVLVDFTAKWCWTCNALVKPALETDTVRNKVAAVNAVALLGDYTKFPANITDELARFERAGVPLVLVYPRKPDQAPIVLPATPTPGMVADALDQAAR